MEHRLKHNLRPESNYPYRKHHNRACCMRNNVPLGKVLASVDHVKIISLQPATPATIQSRITRMLNPLTHRARHPPGAAGAAGAAGAEGAAGSIVFAGARWVTKCCVADGTAACRVASATGGGGIADADPDE